MKTPTLMNTHRCGTLPSAIRTIGLALALVFFGNAFALAADDPEAPGHYTWAGQVTLSLDVHIYGSGFQDGRPEFITRYTPLRDFAGDDYPGYWADISSISIGLRDN
jgi:hypothetical protein